MRGPVSFGRGGRLRLSGGRAGGLEGGYISVDIRSELGNTQH